MRNQMKKSELRIIIREQIKKVLIENNKNVEKLKEVTKFILKKLNITKYGKMEQSRDDKSLVTDFAGTEDQIKKLQKKANDICNAYNKSVKGLGIKVSSNILKNYTNPNIISLFTTSEDFSVSSGSSKNDSKKAINYVKNNKRKIENQLRSELEKFIEDNDGQYSNQDLEDVVYDYVMNTSWYDLNVSDDVGDILVKEIMKIAMPLTKKIKQEFIL